MSTTPFSNLLSTATDSPGTSTFDVPDDWGMGRTTFGGLQAAIALRAMRTLVPAEIPLRTLQITFVAPVPTGRIEARARILRQGKNATQVEARIVEGDETLAVMLGVFGLSRPSSIRRVPVQPTVEAKKPAVLRFQPGIDPNFTQHFEARWVRGQPPFTGGTETSHVVEIALKDSSHASEFHVLAMADFIPPIALSLLNQFATGGSMTWMLELLADRFDDLALDGWRVDAELVAGGAGYTSQSVMVWGPRGVPIAISRQSMFVFA